MAETLLTMSDVGSVKVGIEGNAQSLSQTLSGRFGIYNMHADHGIVIFERWY